MPRAATMARMAIRLVCLSIDTAVEPIAGAAVTALESLDARLIHQQQVDLEQLAETAAQWLGRAQAMVVAGGVGVSAEQRTPQVVAPLLDHPLPGIAERLRAHAFADPADATLARCGGGAAQGTLVLWLPADTHHVRRCLETLIDAIDAFARAVDPA